MKLKDFLIKLQGLPETQKKAILWTIVIIMLAIMGFFWIRSASDKLSKIGEDMKNVQLPQVEIPDIQPNDLIGEKIEDQTADWKTYTNDKYSFEIKYPSTLSVKEDSSNISFTSVRFEENGYGLYSLYVGNSEGKNIVDIINPKSSDYTEIKNSKSTVNNIDWNMTEELSIPQEGIGTAGSFLNIYTSKVNSTYIFQCSNCNEDIFRVDGINKKAVFDQILLTFKFTK